MVAAGDPCPWCSSPGAQRGWWGEGIEEEQKGDKFGALLVHLLLPNLFPVLRLGLKALPSTAVWHAQYGARDRGILVGIDLGVRVGR